MKAVSLITIGCLVAASALYLTGGIAEVVELKASGGNFETVTKNLPRESISAAAPDISPAPRKGQGSATTVSDALLPNGDSAGKILTRLQEASVTYDPASLDVIAPHLASSDPVVRRAALDAVVTLGHSSGAEILRQAAARISNSLEAKELRAKADYLELPPASLLPLEKLRSLRAPSPRERHNSNLHGDGLPRESSARGQKSNIQ